MLDSPPEARVSRRTGRERAVGNANRVNDPEATINLRAGTYRVKVNPRYGYLGATSAAVRILR